MTPRTSTLTISNALCCALSVDLLSEGLQLLDLFLCDLEFDLKMVSAQIQNVSTCLRNVKGEHIAEKTRLFLCYYIALPARSCIFRKIFPKRKSCCSELVPKYI